MSTWLKTLARAARLDPKQSPASRALAIAEALANEGSYHHAVLYGLAANRGQRDAMLEYRLVEWRRLAFDPKGSYRGRPDWPPAVVDHFAGVRGQPEIAAKDLTSELLTSAIVHHGGLIVRGLIPADEAARLADGIDRATAACQAHMAGAPLEQTLPWYAPLPLDFDPSLDIGRSMGRQNGSIWAVDSPRMLFDLIELYDRCGIVRLLSEHLGERPVLSVAKFTLRHIPPTIGSDWHQDGAFLGGDIRAVNLWLSLSHCGDDAPGLDIVGRRIPYVVETGTHGAAFDWSVGPERAVIEAQGAPIVTPIFEAGDAMLFDHLLLHRTGVRPGMTKDRRAVESWFFAPSTYPVDRGPFFI